ncbi:prenyltransferase/squalene oxidase repeat-containing protein [Gaiella sp.]|uniref:prenyltransferase/squalene oxidase repeat-containing protein n=1 Tax=Gaiella sp. TaxID=2663207 RepID=UPI0032668CD0
MRWVLSLVASAVLAGTAAGATGPAGGAAAFLTARQSPNGGFAEQGQTPDGSLTAWAALALVAANGSESARSRAREFLRTRPTDRATDGDVALLVVAFAALGERVDTSLLVRLREHRPGALVNETMWAAIALRAVGEQPPAGFVRAILSAQAKGGGFPWLRGGKPDSNDTAAAIQALRAAGLRTGHASIRRAVAALRGFQGRDGGFALTKGREPDAQSTAWAIQALLSAGEKPGKAPFRFLSRLRRSDGSYRYSVRYGATPVWVTAQVIPALTGRPFPLR